MQDFSILWLRVAAGLYSVGLIHAILTVLRRKLEIFRVALGTFAAGSLFHFVSLVEYSLREGHFPANNFFESVSLCGFLLAVVFLLAYWRYHFESLSVILFPLVFLMTLIGGMHKPVGHWTNPGIRDAWLLVHVVLVLVGYAALCLMAAACILCSIWCRSGT